MKTIYTHIAAKHLRTFRFYANHYGLKLEALGKFFRSHPGTGVFGCYDDPVDMNVGTTQGWASTKFREQPGFKLETLSVPADEMLRVDVPPIAAAKYGDAWMNPAAEVRVDVTLTATADTAESETGSPASTGTSTIENCG